MGRHCVDCELVTAPGPRHLAILSPTFARGGSEEYLLAMTRWAKAQGWSVTVCLPDAAGVASVRRELADEGIYVEPIAAFPEFAFSDVLFLQGRGHAVHTLRRLSVDRIVIVVPSIEWGGAFIDAAAQCGIPAAVVYQLVGYPYRFIDLEKGFYTWARRQRQVWATVSAQNRDLLCASLGWADDAIEVVPNSLLHPLAPPTPADRAAARLSVTREIGAPRDAVIVLTVARLHTQKAFDVLAQAAAAVTATHANHAQVHFVWVGDGPASDLAAGLVDELRLRGRLHLAGHRTDVPRYLAAADVFVLPSRFEGYPFAAIEAMASGLPTVLSDIGPHRDLAQQGRAALLVAVDDPAALASAIERLVQDGAFRDCLTRAAHERSRDFAPGTSFARLFGLLEDAAAGGPPRRPLWPLPPSTRRTRIAIYGTGAGGRRAYAERMPNVDVVAFLDRQINEPAIFGVPVLPPAAIRDLDIDRVIVASRAHAGSMIDTLHAAGCPDDTIEVFSILRLVDPGELELP